MAAGLQHLIQRGNPGLNNIFDLITNHNIKLSHYVGTGRSIVPRVRLSTFLTATSADDSVSFRSTVSSKDQGA